MLPNLGVGSHRSYQMDLSMWFTLDCKERTLDELKIIGQVPYSIPRSVGGSSTSDNSQDRY
ncbi:uncharacterized protein BJ212DRAFT_1366429 [Suillus subaureus]|uniref:Uncharacterized protein n=1 Tax=Suillus subaureus TaxID=48587 RepID=A0A9P7E8C9_9AGAM|nr:uncharacterized protein BJ212DRAFT_1366429 [Suillus subaureus]KAG1813661.1 hypothetical protein BJ212DRAFT_1366429 [Suillus subaureus]